MTRIPFDPEAIRVLANILTDTGLTEIEISENDSRIRLVKTPPVAAPVAVPVPVAQTAPATTGRIATQGGGAAVEEAAALVGAVHSPMVGIAYLSPEPGAQPYIQIGQRVTVGQTLLLIEAMKTFNQIKAPRDGTVTRILVVTGAPVEYDEPLLVIEP